MYLNPFQWLNWFIQIKVYLTWASQTPVSEEPRFSEPKGSTGSLQPIIYQYKNNYNVFIITK